MEDVEKLFEEVTFIKERVDKLWSTLYNLKNIPTSQPVSFDVDAIVKKASAMPIEKYISLSDEEKNAYLSLLFSVAFTGSDFEDESKCDAVLYPCRIAAGFHVSETVPIVLKNSLKLTENSIDRYIKLLNISAKNSLLADCFIICLMRVFQCFILEINFVP